MLALQPSPSIFLREWVSYNTNCKTSKNNPMKKLLHLFNLAIISIIIISCGESKNNTPTDPFKDSQTLNFNNEKNDIHFKGDTVYYKGKTFNGILERFYNPNKLTQKTQFINGIRDDYYVSYYGNGNIREIGKYKSNKKVGIWRSYYEYGGPTFVTDFSDRDEYGGATVLEFYPKDKYYPHTKVTFTEAEAFMQKRCEEINQTLMKKKSTTFNGTKLYMFLSVAENGDVCISSVSEHALKIIGVDCGSSSRKIEEWNAIQ